MHNIKYMLIFAEKNIKYCIMKLRLKEILEEKGLTSAAFSEMVGVHKVSISYIINGKQMPSVDTLERFADVLDVDFADLFVSKTGASERFAEVGLLLVVRNEFYLMGD